MSTSKVRKILLTKDIGLLARLNLMMGDVEKIVELYRSPGLFRFR